MCLTLLQLWDDKIHHHLLHRRAHAITGEQVTIRVEHILNHWHRTILQEQLPEEVSTEETCLTLDPRLVLLILLLGIICTLRHIVDTLQGGVTLADATVAALPRTGQLCRSSIGIIVADIEAHTCTTGGDTALCQVGSCIQPTIAYPVASIEQEVVGIEMELLHCCPTAECLVARQLIARLLVEETAKGILAGGKSHTCSQYHCS